MIHVAIKSFKGLQYSLPLMSYPTAGIVKTIAALTGSLSVWQCFELVKVKEITKQAEETTKQAEETTKQAQETTKQITIETSSQIIIAQETTKQKQLEYDTIKL